MSSDGQAIDTNLQQIDAPINPVPQEKMLPQSEVNRIVGAAKAKERAEIEAQYRQGMGGMQQPAFDEDAIVSKAAERMRQEMEAQRKELEEQQYKAQIDGLAGQYLDKMKAGAEMYEDFEDVVKDYNPQAFPEITLLAAQMDNTPDIVYDLIKNPTKLTHLQTLLARDPNLARREMAKLSESIKRNENALNNNVKSPSPLSKLKPSTQAGSDMGKRTVRDMRKDPRFRG